MFLRTFPRWINEADRHAFEASSDGTATNGKRRAASVEPRPDSADCDPCSGLRSCGPTAMQTAKGGKKADRCLPPRGASSRATRVEKNRNGAAS
jgi:hypothetical protein